MKKFKAVWLGCMGALCSVVVQAAGTMQPGEWQVSNVMQMAGMPAQTVTVSRCIKPEQAKNPTEAMSQVGEQMKKMQCSPLNPQISGNSVKYHLECKGEMKMKLDGQFTYGTNEFHGTQSMTMDSGPQGTMTMQHQISGKRVGDCK